MSIRAEPCPGEVERVVRHVVAAISRYASALDGLLRRLTLDPVFKRIRDRDLIDGQHRNDGTNRQHFTTAFFHRPQDLAAEMHHAGVVSVSVLGVEGPGWMLQDFDARWEATRTPYRASIARSMAT